MPKQPIVFDFFRGRAYRAGSDEDIGEAMNQAVAKAGMGKVVRKTVEGIPPHVVAQPKP